MTAVEIATAYLTLVPSAVGIQAAVAREVTPAVAATGAAGDQAGRRFGAGFGSSLKGAVGTTAIVAAGAAAVSLIKDSVAEAREAQKVGAVTEQIIKSTGGAANLTAQQVGNLAAAISNKTGVDDEAIQAGANLLLTFKNVRDEAGKGNDVFARATAAASDLSAAGFGSIEAGSKMLGKALNDPLKGITALSKAGVTFTDQQKEQIAALVETGDLLGAQKIILGEVESQVGGTAAASATAGEKASVAWGNFKETIGTGLLPVIDAFQVAATTVFGYLSEHQGLVTAIAVGLGVLAVALGIATVAQWAMNSALLANPATWIIVGIVALIAALAALIMNWDKVVAWLKGVWGNIVGWLQGVWSSVVAGVSGAWTWIQTQTTAVWGAILGFFRSIGDRIRAAFSAVWDFMKTVFSWTPIGMIVGHWDEILAFFRQLPSKVKALLSNAGDWLYEAGKDILEGLARGIGAAVAKVVNTVKDIASKVTSTFKGALGINSPSRVFAGYGANIGEGLIVGVDSVQSRVAARMQALVGAPTAGLARASAAQQPAGALFGGNGSVTLLDADGSILARTELITDGKLAGVQRRARGAAARRGLRSIAVGG